MKQKNELTNRDLQTFLHNAEITTAERIEAERIPVLIVWKHIFIEEIKEWAEKQELSVKESIFVLTSVAKHLQDEITWNEDRNKKGKKVEAFNKPGWKKGRLDRT